MVLFGPSVQPGWVSALISTRFDDPVGSVSESELSIAIIAAAKLEPPSISSQIAQPYAFHPLPPLESR